MKNTIIHSQQTSEERKKALIKYMSERTSGGIQTYEQYIKNLGNQRTSRELKNNLDIFKKKLEKDSGNEYVDPIRYLMRLYYLKGLSTEEVLEEIKDKGLNYSNARGLRRLFSETFGWELLEAGEDHPLKAEKRKTTIQVTKLNKYNDDISTENTNRFNEKLLGVLKNKKTFSKKEFESYTGKRSEQSNKISYLLECFEGISLQDGINIGIDAGLGARVIKRILDEKLEKIRKNIGMSENLEASLTNIGKVIRKHKNTN